jgi:oligopeptide/dipeptide ABC transporter ATP-binding protein
LFITHDISVVRHLSDEVAVMYLGEIVEQGPKEQVFANPRHPYTKMLFAAVPDFHAESLNESLLKANEIPSPIDLPHGCFFQTRCPLKDQRCEDEHPALECREQKVRVRCFKA